MDNKAEIIIYIILLIFLSYFSYVDIRLRKVPGKAVEVYAALGLAAGLGLQLRYEIFPFFTLLGGVLLAGLFFLVSRLTKEAFGYGDSWGILGLASVLGLWDLMSTLCLAFFVLAVCGLCLFPFRKLWQITLPFFPFLTFGFFCTFLIKLA